LSAVKLGNTLVKELCSWSCGTIMHVAHWMVLRLEGEDQFKDIDFTSTGVSARREAVYADTPLN
jgi:NTE family protein